MKYVILQFSQTLKFSVAGMEAILLRLDLQTLEWMDLSRAATGSAPVARSFHGFAEAGGLLYVFGGRYAFDFKGPLNARQTPFVGLAWECSAQFAF
jgi:hypothetical protein